MFHMLVTLHVPHNNPSSHDVQCHHGRRTQYKSVWQSTQFMFCSNSLPSFSKFPRFGQLLPNFTPVLTIYFYFCPSTEAKYGKDAGLLSNCGARDCLITLQQWMKPCSARSCMQHGACSCQEVYVSEALI